MKQITKTLKFLAVFLVFALCLQILPQIVLRTWAEEIADYFATEQTVIENEASETVVSESEEIVARRTETAKHFRMSDGTVLAADYPLPVHYEKDGQWVDIDNTLSSEGGEYVAENEFTVRFAENGNSHKLLELSKDGYSIRFGISSSAKSSAGKVVNPGYHNDKTQLTKLTSGVYYTEVMDHVDLEYQLISNRIKENIIIKEALESYTFAFDLKLHGLSAELQQDGSIALKDGDAVLWTIPAPFAYDANGNLTDDVFFTLTQKGNSGNYTLTVTLSSAWAQTAAFPVVIDPYLTKPGSSGIASVSATRWDAAGDYYLGASDTLDVTLQSLSQMGIPSRALISSGLLRLPVKTAPAAEVVLGAYEIINGTPSSALMSKASVLPDTGAVALDITAAVREWQTASVNPIRICPIQYTAGSCEMLLRSVDTEASYKPRVSIRYYDSVGLEDYFSYSEFPLTSSAVYVKHATGQETAVVNCLSAALPVSLLDVTAVYNSDPITEFSPEDYFTGLPGNNWRFTVHEYVLYNDTVSYGDVSSYVFVDGDGTAHYFVYASPNVYHDENGKGLTLTVNPQNLTVTLSDRSNNTKQFSFFGESDSVHAYYLTDESTEAGHWVHYEYQTVNGKKQLYEISSRVPEALSDGSVLDVETESVTFLYDSNGRPSQMTQRVGSETRYRTTLRYNSSGQLITIAKESFVGSSSGTVALTRLLYTGNRVTSVYDDTIRYDLTYTNNRVSAVQQRGQVNLANAAGATVGFSYASGITTLRSAGSDDLYGNGDDLYTHYVYDQYGRTVSTHVTDSEGKVYQSSVYDYTPSGTESVNYAMHKLSRTVYGGSNSLFGNQSGAIAQNLLSDSSFESGSYWTFTNASRVAGQGKLGSYGLKIAGDGKASQTYTGASFQGKPKVFLVSGWAKADSMNTTDTGATFELRVLVTYTVSCSGNAPITRTDTVHIPFQWLCDDWQYASGAVVVESKEDDVVQSIVSVAVECVYENNVNTAYFDAVTLCEGIYEAAEYDENGHLISSSSSVGSGYSYSYDSNHRVTGVTRNKANGTTESASYSYGTGRFGQYLTSAQLPQDLKTEYTYNSYGQITSSRVYSVADDVTDSPILQTQQIYNSQGLLTASYDARGILSEVYGYSDLLLSVCSSGGISTHYEYNGNETLSRTWVGTESSAGVTSANAPVTYGYNEYNPLLLETVTTPQNTYTFVYDSFGNVTQLKGGNTALVSYTYQQGYGKLASMTYANGYTERYTYNNLGLVSALYRNNSTTPAFSFSYDNNGNLTQETDHVGGESTTYHYDTLSRLTGYTRNINGSSYGFVDATIDYDGESRVSGIYYGLANANVEYSFSYGDSDLPEGLEVYGYFDRSYTYDCMQRVSSISMSDEYDGDVFSTNYTFLSGWNSSTYTTAMVETERNTAVGETLKYVYDSAGRVSQVLRNNTVINKYTYDETTGFLVREDNADAGKSYVYTYDEMGNILSRHTYNFTTGTLGSVIDTKSWYYGGDSAFGRRCSGISGQDDFSFDALGNITYNQETCEEFRWNGRELTRYDTGSDQYYYYSYNSDGVRTKKVLDVYGDLTTTYYTVEGTKILSEVRDDGLELVFYYDENGSPIALSCGGSAPYYYYKNVFGDILGILDSCGNVVVRYAYDAWGNPISTTGSMASTLGKDNPFRYRGYYYDTETGFYYLNARYYNPEWCRFISADPVLDTSSAVGCNMFAYCGNDPVNKVDPTGNLATTGVIALWKLAAAALGLIVASAATIEIAKNPPALPSLSWPKFESKSKGKAQDIAIPARKKDVYDQTYYHSTTLAAAQTIRKTGIMRGSSWESGHVFAWRMLPNEYAVKNSGAHLGVIISFKTTAPFIPDNGISDPKVAKFLPVRSLLSGSIHVWDVKIVKVFK